MPKYVLFFRSKHGEDPAPFSKTHLPPHDYSSTGKCYATILEAPTKERAWNLVLACYPDYQDAGAKELSEYAKMPSREKPDTLVEPDLDWIIKKHT